MNTETIKRRLAKRGIIAIFWYIDDVKNVRPDLNDEQCLKVLEQCERDHDAETGINWDVIEYHADDLFPEPAEGIPSTELWSFL